MLDFVFATPKRHILGRNGLFWRILRQNPSRVLGCSELQEPQKTKKLAHFWCAKSRMRGDETPGRIRRLRGLGVAGGQILGFSIDLLRRPYNTIALLCECVMFV